MTQPFTIETGIPIPPPKQQRHTGLTAQLRAMKPGDSFVAAAADRNTIASCARHGNVRVATRVVGGGQTRVWRLE